MTQIGNIWLVHPAIVYYYRELNQLPNTCTVVNGNGRQTTVEPHPLLVLLPVASHVQRSQQTCDWEIQEVGESGESPASVIQHQRCPSTLHCQV